MSLTPTSDHQTGYNEASNDLATALMELRRGNVVNIRALVERFKELRAIRFES